MSYSKEGNDNDYYPIGQDVADMKTALRAGEEYLDHDAEWWAQQLQSVFAPELIEDVTGIPQSPQEPQASEGPADGDELDPVLRSLQSNLDEFLSCDPNTLTNKLLDVKDALRAGNKYLDHDAEWWAEQLDFMFEGELIEEVTGVPQKPDDDFDQSMMRLAAFNVDGSHYDPAWEVNFPIFDGEAPEGHPHPLAFAVNYARLEEDEEEGEKENATASASAPPAMRRTTARRAPLSGAGSAQKRQRRRVTPTPESGSYGQLRM